MKGGWRAAPLDHLATFINGLWKGENPPFVHVGVIRNTNFTKECALDDADIAYLDVEAKKFKSRQLQFGDLILEKSGGGPKQPVGRVVLFEKKEGDFSFGNFTSAIRVIDKNEIDPRFLHKYLHWVYLSGRTESMQSHSTGIRNLNGDAYKAIEVPYPLLTEQRRIIAILDEAFEGIATAKANAERNLQNAGELGNRLRNGIFLRIAESAKRRRLGEVCTFVRGPFGGSLKKASFVGDGYAVYEQSHAIYDQFSAIRYFVSQAKFDEMRRFELQPNDLIMSCSGTMGRVAIAPPGLRRGIINQALLKLTPSISVNAEYLKYWMDSYDFQDALAQCSGGAAIQNVASVSVLKEIALPLPPLEDQQMAINQIKAFIAESERLQGCYDQKLLALEELKKSILHQAFTGQL